MSQFKKLIFGFVFLMSFSVLMEHFFVNNMAIAAEGDAANQQSNPELNTTKPKTETTTQTRTMNPNSLAWVLLFAGIVLTLEAVAVWTAAIHWHPQNVIKMFGLTLVALSAIILVAMQAGATEISAVIGLLGTIAGHLVTTDGRNPVAPPVPTAPTALEIGSLTANGTSVDVKYVSGGGSDASTLQLLYQIMGVDPDFAHPVAVVPAGQTIGPFAAGSTINVKTIATNAAGSTESSIKTITLP